MKGTNAQSLPASGDTSFKARTPLSAAITITVLFAASLAVGLSYAGYYFLLRPSTRLNAISYRDLIEIVKLAFTVVAGIGGVIALTVAVRKQKFAERQHRLSEVDADRQDRRILDERFRNAIMQLGEKESAAVRIGGAYALAKLADDWLAERQTCINVLCGYLRFPYDSLDNSGEREVRRTIANIVRQRLLRGAEVSWDGSLFDLTGAVLDHLDLSDIILKTSTLRLYGCLIQTGTFTIKGISVLGLGNVDARNVQLLDGGTLDAQGARLSEFGEVSLAGSAISSGTVTFEGAQITGGWLALNNINVDANGVLNLSHLKIAGVPTEDADLSPLKLNEATISGGTVNLDRIGVIASPNEQEVTWGGGREEERKQLVASFEELILADGEVSFRHAKLPYGDFSFSGATFTGGVLNFEHAELNDCHLDFMGAKIDGGCINFSNSRIGTRLSDNSSPSSEFVYEWLEGLRIMKDVPSRDMVWNKHPSGVVEFLDAELCHGHLEFNRVRVRGALLDFPGMQASGGTITFTDGMFECAAISFWNAHLSGDCKIEIQPFPGEDVTVLYSQAWGGLNGRVALGKQVKLLEVSGAD